MFKRKYVYSNVVLILTLFLFSGLALGKNVILLIGDGMGPEQINAASIYETGKPDRLFFHTAPVQGDVVTDSYGNALTDSAAAATAMATGKKVDNGVLSLAIPGNGSSYETILETAKKLGMGTGLVTTTEITHATPAAFGSHTRSRGDDSIIAQNYLNLTKPDILAGGGSFYLKESDLSKAGYEVIGDKKAFEAYVPTGKKTPIAMLFGRTHIPFISKKDKSYPQLQQMAAKALSYLSDSPKGFFLMIEGGRIDHGGHKNQVEDVILETIEFSKTIEGVVKWAKANKDTLVIVTADHETGGLKLLETDFKGKIPKVSWQTKGHTKTPVKVFAWGPGSEKLKGKIDNTDIYKVMRSAL